MFTIVYFMQIYYCFTAYVHSISAVSQVELRTMRKDDMMGTCIVIEDQP